MATYSALINTIRSNSSSAEDKTEASATIALRLLKNQAMGGQLTDINAKFAAGPESFADLVSKIQTSISGL